MRLTRFCLENPTAVALVALAVAAAGLLALVRMGRAVLPPIAFPVVAISAPYPGAGPAELERLVVEPIEDQLDGLAGVERVSAWAQDGIARIAVRFRYGTPLDAARVDVQQAVDAARAVMPPDLVPPIVSRDDPSQPPIYEAALSSALLDPAALADLVDHTLLPALRATPGVGSVVATGEPVRQVTVVPRAAALIAAGATVLDVERAVAQQNAVLPGGTFTTPLAQRGVGIRSGAATAAELAALPVLVPGAATPPRVGELATVRDGLADPVELVQVDGTPAIVVVVTGARSSDATRTIAALRRTVARLGASAPLVRIEELRTSAPFANAAVNGVLQTLAEGVVLTVAVILIFLRRWRASLVAAIAIPISLAAAFAAMWAAGFTLDVLSLMGLSLTVGILVDDSIVIVEAIARAVRRGERGDAAALSGRRELGSVAVAITAVDVAVFAPIAFMPGLIGAFMREFGLVVVFATAFSLLVSFTLAPLLAARWAVRDGGAPRDGKYRELRAALARDAKRLPWTLRAAVLSDAAAAWQAALATFAVLERALAHRYADRWLPAAWRRRGFVLAGAALVCALALVPVANGTIPSEFSPPVARGEVAVDLTFPPGTTLAHAGAGAARIAARLLDDPAVLHVVASAGRAFNGTTDVVAPNLAQVDAILADPSDGGAAVRREIDALAALAPDASIAGAGTGMGGLPPIGYALAGSPAAVDDAARRIARRLGGDPNASDVRISSGGLAPRLEIAVDSARAQLLGVVPDDAALTARIATGGTLATRLRLDRGLVDVVVREPSAQHGDLGALRQVEVRAANGNRVPLSTLAAFDDRPQPALVERENRERIVTVSANTRNGVPIGTVTTPLRAALRAPGFLPPGVRLVARGDLEQFLNAVAAIGAALGLGVVAVYATLVLLYRSWRLPLVIMLTVPLASAGAFGTLALLNVLHDGLPSAALLQGQTLNLYSMLGIVMLVGLVAKNGILLVEFAERDVRAGGDPLAAIAAAGARRFRPIVMTTLAMIAGMLPLALGDAIGAEYRKALGTVVIGGLASSLVLTLFVVPLVYAIVRLRDRREPRVRAFGAPDFVALAPAFSRVDRDDVGGEVE